MNINLTRSAIKFLKDANKGGYLFEALQDLRFQGDSNGLDIFGLMGTQMDTAEWINEQTGIGIVQLHRSIPHKNFLLSRHDFAVLKAEYEEKFLQNSLSWYAKQDWLDLEEDWLKTS